MIFCSEIPLVEFCHDDLGVPYDPGAYGALARLAEVARSCAWWWPFKRMCLVSERPAELHMAGGRLHREDGPAACFRDGWRVWAIDGVVVDEQIVLRPETQTRQQIRREWNLEVKRIRIQRLGWRRYLDAAGAVVVDRRRNDIEATRESLVRFPDGDMLLICSCPSTGRVFGLDVPHHVRTCEGAQAWLSGGLAGRIINEA
jgi:hypothetical protein